MGDQYTCMQRNLSLLFEKNENGINQIKRTLIHAKSNNCFAKPHRQERAENTKSFFHLI